MVSMPHDPRRRRRTNGSRGHGSPSPGGKARRDFGALHWARTFVGSILIGAGAFNLIEGIIDHQILSIHHVRTDTAHVFLGDMGFLALGAALVIIVWAMVRSAARGEQGTS
jgi:uncharacterized membrane protein